MFNSGDCVQFVHKGRTISGFIDYIADEVAFINLTTSVDGLRHMPVSLSDLEPCPKSA
jgi:hypothetical protein